MSSSMALPTALPTTFPTITPNSDNVTTDLSIPYIDYVSSIPNLSTSLTSLGRAWHREMNAPVNEAIRVLQESVTTLQTTMIQNELISSPAVLRTIRAGSSLESAQQAWSRFLNLPASAGGSDFSHDTPSILGRSVQRLTVPNGKYYTHNELWGRKEHSIASELSQHDHIIESGRPLQQRRRQPFKA